MYCSSCGSEINDTVCTSCLRASPLTPRGKIDLRTGLMLAGWWRRVGATFSDNLILLLPTLIVYSLFAELDVLVIGAVVALAARGIYYVKFLSGERGQTLGNRVAASRVRDSTTGKRITLRQAFRRWSFSAIYTAFILGPHPVAQIVFYVAVLTDCLFPLYDPRNQTLHDKFAGTLVVVA